MRHIHSIKEVVRHLLVRCKLEVLLYWFRERKGFQSEHLRRVMTADRFSEIYARGVWVHSPGQASRSGLGSAKETEEGIGRPLVKTLIDLRCKSLVDVGCGDFSWMQHIELPCAYLGVDIVGEVIAENQRYKKSGIDFMRLNAIVEPIPRCDVVLCREVLFHLSLTDALSVLRNIKLHAQWLIVTNDPGLWFNSDIRSGDFRALSLERRPFSFPPPKIIITDGMVDCNRILGVWCTKQILR